MLRRILALMTPLVAGCTTTTFASLSRRSSFFTRPVKPPGIRDTFASTRAPGMASLMADRAPRTTESPITLTGPFAARISSSDATGSPLSVLSSVVVLLSVASGSAADSVDMSAVAFASAASCASDDSSSMASSRGPPSAIPMASATSGGMASRPSPGFMIKAMATAAPTTVTMPVAISVPMARMPSAPLERTANQARPSAPRRMGISTRR